MTNANASSTWGTGQVTGGRLFCRKQPIPNYEYWGRFNDGAIIPIKNRSDDWYETYWNGDTSKVGYVMKQFITNENWNGGGGTTPPSGNYTAIVCQGNTNSASDCRIAHNKLATQYGQSQVTARGFSTSSNTPFNPCAGISDFNSARNYDVLYFSTHGTNTPTLNVGASNAFNSYNAAYNSWRSINNRLKVPIFSACSQLDGTTNRTRWASIMRNSDIRAICGYHASSPTGPSDDAIATAFFNYCKAGNTGNSVMYSWKNANTPNSGGNYMVLVYYNDNQCYYRLPGFSSQTYRNPNRNTDSIYAYASFYSGGSGVVPNRGSSQLSELLPYELEIITPVSESMEILTGELAGEKRSKLGESSGNVSFCHHEPLLSAVDIRVAHEFNRDAAQNIISSSIRNQAIVRHFDDVSILVDDKRDAAPQVIGATTQYFNHYQGVLIERNCVVISSDKDGVNTITNLWTDVAPTSTSKMVNVRESTSRVKEKLQADSLAVFVSEREDSADLIYIQKGERYVLHHTFKLATGGMITLDCLAE